MPVELGVWRIDQGLNRLEIGSMANEKRLEDILDKDIRIASPNWMVIGRQVPTAYGQYVDLMAIDRDGNLIILELKRDKTPRDVVAQLLDYGSWIKELQDDDIVSIYNNYLKKYHPENADVSLDGAFCKHFKVQKMPEALNISHELVVVASALDESTERIVSYLAGEHRVNINALFFRVFRDGDCEYLSRIWFIDPITSIGPDSESKEPWNGEFYVSFDTSFNWDDAVEFGFIIGGGGQWYSKTLFQLEPSDRIWVNVPGTGYVGVGNVTDTAVKVDKFKVKQKDGNKIILSESNLRNSSIFEKKDDEELANYLVPVDWIKTVKLNKAIKEKGFFGNQNTVCKPTAKSWVHTIERLKRRFVVD